VELSRGIFWARIPLPFKPSHVNIWLLADDIGWTVIDAGIDTADARDALLMVLDSVGRPSINHVLVTHSHIDHVGLAGWLCQETGARLAMSRTEWLQARALQIDAVSVQSAAFFRVAGAPAALLDELPGYLKWMADNTRLLPPTFDRRAAGERLSIGGRCWKVLTGGGHSSEQIMLHCPEADILIAADHLLPKINPAISARPEEPFSDPLEEGFASLALLETLPGGTLVLPSHGEPFHGISPRCRAARDHHEARLKSLISYLPDGLSAFDALALIFRPGLPLSALRIPLAECWALLVHLEISGHASSFVDGEGIRRFVKKHR